MQSSYLLCALHSLYERARGIFILNFIAFGCNPLFNSFDMAIERYCFLLQFLYLCSSSLFFSFVFMDFLFSCGFQRYDFPWNGLRFDSIRLPPPQSIPWLPFFISCAPIPFILLCLIPKLNFTNVYYAKHRTHLPLWQIVKRFMLAHSIRSDSTYYFSNYGQLTTNRISKRNEKKKTRWHEYDNISLCCARPYEIGFQKWNGARWSKCREKKQKK